MTGELCQISHPIPIEDLKELVWLDPATSKLFWKKRARKYCANDRVYKAWNKRLAGKETFIRQGPNGYRSGTIFGHHYYAHRVVFALTHGRWPKPDHELDHINGKRADNHPANLREVTRQQNAKNTKLRKDNKSGVCGVFFNQKQNNWIAYIQAGNKQKHLGCFDEFEDAVAARWQAERLYGFHENHGRF